ncbi:unnamed protein product [Triticum aestivum]|uniref:(bread wheat) hypothetical protein n=1 Tax=Triticum aestivum TaxID=4565 RepID=A0A7G2IGF8_WHEAT|nr:unnamed protein product [Triticum aestivum]
MATPHAHFAPYPDLPLSATLLPSPPPPSPPSTSTLSTGLPHPATSRPAGAGFGTGVAPPSATRTRGRRCHGFPQPHGPRGMMLMALRPRPPTIPPALWATEAAAHEVLLRLHPTEEAERRRHRVVDYAKNLIGCEVMTSQGLFSTSGDLCDA